MKLTITREIEAEQWLGKDHPLPAGCHLTAPEVHWSVDRKSWYPVSRTGQVEIQAVNLKARVVFVSDGRVFPITNLLDADGEETESEDDAVKFIAGEGNTWFQGDVEAFRGGPRTH